MSSTTIPSTKILWNEQYLKAFAADLQSNSEHSAIFWDKDENSDEIGELKGANIRRMLMKFYPELGVHNLVLGESKDGMPTSTLVFIRNNRCEDIDVEILRTITYKVFNYLGVDGDHLRGLLHSKRSQLFTDDAVRTIPDYKDVEPFCDTKSSAYRFFQNGWIEITKDGVSDLKQYDEMPENRIVWNSSVIARDYIEPKSKHLLEEKITALNASSIHPETGEVITDKEVRKEVYKEYQQKLDEFKEDEIPDTHFRDFVENLAKDDAEEVDPQSLNRLEMAIGYLCHRHHINSHRKYVIFVDKFYDGANGTSNGGNGKSLLVNTLGALMNLTELDGRTFKKGKEDLAAFAPVTPATEICHIDDASKTFPTECLLTRTSGNFHIRRLYKSPFSIPAKHAPKIAITSNFPLPDSGGNTFRRREYIVEVGNFYRLKSELYDETPFELHGYKHFGDDEEWGSSDWVEFYTYIFECISKYLGSNGLPTGGESEYYKRAKCIDLVGDELIFNYLVGKLDDWCDSGEEVFAEKFYRDLRYLYPEHLEEFKNATIWRWLVEIGRSFGKHPNKHLNGVLDKQRLSKERFHRWQTQGMDDWLDVDGKQKVEGDRVQVFKISGTGRHNSSAFSKPNFSKGKKVTNPKNKGSEPDPINLTNFFDTQESDVGMGTTSDTSEEK